MVNILNFVALPMRSLPLIELNGGNVSVVGTPYIGNTEHGSALLMSAGMYISTPLRQVVTNQLCFAMWLRTDQISPPLGIDGTPQEVEVNIMSATTRNSRNEEVVSGWSFSRIQRTDGVSDFVFSTYEDGRPSRFRFEGYEYKNWQFCVFHWRAGEVFYVQVDGNLLECNCVTYPQPLPFGVGSDLVLDINRPIPAYVGDTAVPSSAGDFIHDLFLTTENMIDNMLFVYEISRVGVDAAIRYMNETVISIPVPEYSDSGVAGVVETSAGKFLVDSDGLYYSLQDSKFDAVRNLKSDEFPSDVVPYKVVSGSAFEINPNRGIVLRASGLRLF
jgi:hypothetical protein